MNSFHEWHGAQTGVRIKATSSRWDIGAEQQLVLNQVACGLAAARWGRIDHQTQREYKAFERSEQQQQRARHRQGRASGGKALRKFQDLCTSWVSSPTSQRGR
jgi:hypothetical protein